MPQKGKGIMNMAEMSFTIMKYLGIYRPTSWTSKYAIKFYQVYNCFMLTFLYCFTMTFIVLLLQNFHDFDLLMEYSYYFTGLFVLCLKITYICIYHENLVNLKNMFLQNQCKARDSHEILIKKKFHDIDRSNLRLLLLASLLPTIFTTIGPLISKDKDIKLPYRSWVPNNIDCGYLFRMFYIWQSLGMIICILMFAATELLCSVMMQQICAQLEILMHRLLELPELSKKSDSWNDDHQQESKIIKDCIAHHNYIFTIQRKVNDLFGFMAFVQFFGTIINLCTVIYQLSKESVNHLKFWSLTGTLAAFVLHIFIYCWYGDEMITKSEAITDTIYTMNWTLLTEETKKNLIIIMIRASRPVKLCGASLITMSLATFVKILRTSYSIFNVLQCV